MTKVKRRKALALFLGGAGCLGGVLFNSASQPEIRPALPEGCEWLVFPYSFQKLEISPTPSEMGTRAQCKLTERFTRQRFLPLARRLYGL